ncbi:MAG: DNA methyltransferase [Candidatus Freyarchaeota archaeon]
MPLISFSGETSQGPFWKQILLGRKTQTCRKPRKRPVKKGDALYLYWKCRQPKDKKPVHFIGKAVCTGVERKRYREFAWDYDFNCRIIGVIRKMTNSFYWLIQGDCLKALPKLKPKSVDFTVTSPPFKTYHGDYLKNEYYDWLSEVLEKIERVTRHYLFMFNSSTRLVEICRRFNPYRVLIWYKGVMKYSYRYEPIFVFKFDTNLKINKRIWSDTFKFQPIYEWKVPYENPIGLYEALIGMVARSNDIILDPFAGSGTTMYACQNLGLSSICIEINPDYCEIIRQRCFGRQFLDREVEYKFDIFSDEEI